MNGISQEIASNTIKSFSYTLLRNLEKKYDQLKIEINDRYNEILLILASVTM